MTVGEGRHDFGLQVAPWLSVVFVILLYLIVANPPRPHERWITVFFPIGSINRSSDVPCN